MDAVLLLLLFVFVFDFSFRSKGPQSAPPPNKSRVPCGGCVETFSVQSPESIPFGDGDLGRLQPRCSLPFAPDHGAERRDATSIGNQCRRPSFAFAERATQRGQRSILRPLPPSPSRGLPRTPACHRASQHGALSREKQSCPSALPTNNMLACWHVDTCCVALLLPPTCPPP